MRVQSLLVVASSLFVGCGGRTIQLPHTIASSSDAPDAGTSTIEVSIRPNVGPSVQIVALRVRVDGGPLRAIDQEHPSATFEVAPGSHVLYAEGSFLRCLPDRCHGDLLSYRTVETRVVPTADCGYRAVIDIFDPPVPTSPPLGGWSRFDMGPPAAFPLNMPMLSSPEAPVMNFETRAACSR